MLKKLLLIFTSPKNLRDEENVPGLGRKGAEAKRTLIF